MKLKAEDLGSLDVGSKVFYQKIPVGSVEYYELAVDRNGVVLHLHIRKEYEDLVKRQSRFWNASGIAVEAGLSGVKVKSESVSAILNGGIAFFTPAVNGKPQPAITGDVFTMYDDEEVAREDGTAIEIRFASGQGLSPGAAVKYRGITVGKVREVMLGADLSGVVAKAILNGSAKSMARQGTRFWLVGPELGLSRTANLDTLISGRYIEIGPGAGPPATRFTGLMQAPMEYKALPGLNLVLESDRRGSVNRGNTIYYRQVPVGEVTGYELAPTADRVLIFANIKPRYAPLVRKHSRFWNVSGVNVDFGLFRGLEIDTESIEAIVGGGIAFSTPEKGKMGGPVRSGASFKLFDAPDDKWLAWRPVIRLVR
ncbi:MAG: MlaD family protein [Pseudomonadota bacterium]